MIIRKSRKEKNLTLTELANKTELTQGYLSNLENGNRKPSPEVLKKLSHELDISYSGLLDEAGYKELSKASRFAEAVSDFSDTEEVRDLVIRIDCLEKAMDIKTLLEQHDISFKTENIQPKYNGHVLTEQDRERILGMLHILFPEYQAPGNE